MNVDLVVEGVALALAGWAALKSIPRPPARDWERLFKTTLSTVLRGRVEAEGGDAEAWEAAVLGAVLYNPAARGPEILLAAPDPARIPTPAREGERALVERLAGLADPPARWRLLWQEDHRVFDALFADPSELGADYDPTRALAPDVDWDAVAAWTPAVSAALGRRLDAVVFAVVADDDLAGAIRAELPDARVAGLAPSALADAAALLGLLRAPHERLVLLLRGDAPAAALRLLHDDDALLDRLAGVVALGGCLAGDPWVRDHFRHAAFEPEVLRAIPYASVVEVPDDPAAPEGWADQRFPVPDEPESGRATIDVIDLGPVPRGRVDDDALARALLVVLGFRLG